MRPAATVVVMRDSPEGLTLFCVERHRRSGFGGAVVFPGGQVDESDRDPIWERVTTPLCERCHAFGDGEGALAFAVAALRETLEEAAILAVHGGATPDALAIRSSLTGPSALASLLARDGLLLDTGRLEPLSRWITPPEEAKRFDTRFYLLPCPEGQTGLHDERETTSSFWATPAELLERWARGEILLLPPTSFTVEFLSRAATVAEALALARRQPLCAIRPHFCRDGETLVLALPGDPLYPNPEDTLGEGNPTRFVFDGQRFVTVRP